MPRRHNATGRSSNTGRFVQLFHNMLDSPAWRSLSTQARAVYIEVCKRHNGSNNGAIPLSRREAEKLCRINKDTATRAFKELERKGFLKANLKGSFDYKLSHASEWEITAYEANGAKASWDFLRWQPSPEDLKRSPKRG